MFQKEAPEAQSRQKNHDDLNSLHPPRTAFLLATIPKCHEQKQVWKLVFALQFYLSRKRTK
eukprot:scaffold12004_cov94-Attheya_sp.AAC.1